MWLLDANMDVHLVSVLTDFKISCDTAGKRGWKALSNGDLVSMAVDAGFRCLLTKAVSAIRSRGGERPTATLAQYREQFLALCTEHPIEPVAGQLIQ